jgi:dephospho-CoA kinase
MTGGIGAGKSSASALLVEWGAVLIDADAVARELQAAGGRAFQPMVDLFGDGVIGEDGELDRPAIAKVVFNDRDALAKLNALMLPMIGAEIVERIAAQREKDNIVLLDIPLLGMGTSTNYDASALIVVDCPVDVAVERLVTGPRTMSRADAEARVAAQITREERLKLADFVIDNSGTPDELALAAKKCWEWMSWLGSFSSL